jgi:opacity protein-like surface antigen
MVQGVQGGQHTVGVGLRWDFMKNVALKLQYDRLHADDGSHGLLANVQPGFDPARAINLASVALDFVF